MENHSESYPPVDSPNAQQGLEAHIQNETLAGQVADNLTNSFNQVVAVGDIPPLDSEESNPSKLQAIRGFFTRRKEQLGSATDRLFGRTINSVEFSGKDYIKARLHPEQLRRNLLGNLNVIFGDRQRLEDDYITNNPVLRTAAYRKALTGDAEAHKHLKINDTKYGQVDMSMLDASREAIAIFSGYAAVRKVGLYAIAGVTLAQARNASGERLDGLQKRAEWLIEKDKSQAGLISLEKRRNVAKKVASNPVPPSTKRYDPFAD